MRSAFALVSHMFRSPLLQGAGLLGLLLLFCAGRIAVAAPSDLGELVVYPQRIPTNYQGEVTAEVTISDPTVIAGSVALYELDRLGKLLSKIGVMQDTGINGDRVAGDGIYTLRFPLPRVSDKTVPIKATAAFPRTLLRVESFPQQVVVSSSSTIPTAFALITGDTVRFVNATGAEVSRFRIPATTETQQPIDGDTVFNRIDQNVFRSGDGSRVLVIATELAGAQVESGEFDIVGSSFRLLTSSGELTRIQAPSGRAYYADTRSQLLSAGGTRMLLVDVADGDASPSLTVYDDSGQPVFRMDPNLVVLSSAQIDNSGRYVAVEGTRERNGTYEELVIFIDTATQSTDEVILPPDPPYYGVFSQPSLGFNFILDNVYTTFP